MLGKRDACDMGRGSVGTPWFREGHRPLVEERWLKDRHVRGEVVSNISVAYYFPPVASYLTEPCL